jgi:probable phosphoglycerate mutase
MRLLLIRHAETASNVAGVIDTRAPGPGLTAVGQQQAHNLVATLAGERVETIYVSSQVRTVAHGDTPGVISFAADCCLGRSA